MERLEFGEVFGEGEEMGGGVGFVELDEAGIMVVAAPP